MTTKTKECPICLDDLHDPLLLPPCIHAFCRDCLEHYCRNKSPGQEMPCPVCKTLFEIPPNGVDDLPMRTHCRDSDDASDCEACAKNQATVYCDDCCQKLCSNCAIPHRKMRGGPHDVIPLESANPERSGRCYCEKHSDERMKLYCLECKINVCSMCCLEMHRSHTYEHIETVLERSVKSIDDNVASVMSRVDRLRGAAAQIEEEKNMMSDNVKTLEQEVTATSTNLVEKFRQLVHRQASDLWQELQLLKSTAEEDAVSRTQALQLAVEEMENFKHMSLRLRSQGSWIDIIQAADDVSVRVAELLRDHVVPAEYHATRHKFTAVNTDDLLTGCQNFVGHVDKVGDTVNNTRIVALSRNENAAEQQEQQNDSIESCRQSYLNSAATVTCQISTNNVWVIGVTSVDNELFLLLRRDDDQVAVYSSDDFQLLRHLNVPGLKQHVDNDMTSCVQRKCLYVSDRDNRSIHRYVLASSTASEWPVSGRATTPGGLSATLSCNVLVACHEPCKLVELSADNGQCVREIALRQEIECPWHGVQLAGGQFVVCYGLFNNLHRVCIVDDGGKVSRSYGGQCSSEDRQLACPRHLAVDRESRGVFVANSFNKRIVLLNEKLQFVRYINEALSRPRRLYFDQATRRLFVGHDRDKVSVIQL